MIEVESLEDVKEKIVLVVLSSVPLNLNLLKSIPDINCYILKELIFMLDSSDSREDNKNKI